MKLKGVYPKLLAGLLVLHFFVNLFWQILNNAPVPWDSANHTYISISILENVKNFDLLQILHSSNYYPILVHFLTALMMLFTGVDIKLIQFSATIHLILTLMIIFIYIRNLTNNDRVAFFTTAIFSFFPVTYNWSHFLMLDIPSVGFLFLALYFFQKSYFLKNKRFSLVFFISAGLLAMTKWTALLYLAVPAGLFLFNFFKENFKFQRIKNSLYGIGTFGLIILPWYLINFKEFFFRAKIYAAGDPSANPQIILSVENFLEYYKIFLYSQVTPLPAMIFIICLTAFLFLKIKHKWFIFMMILINYLLFSLIRDKDARFTMHILVFISLVISLVFEKIYLARKILGQFLFAAFSSILALYFLILSLRPEFLEGYKFSTDLPVLGGYEFININDSLVKKYDTDSWSMNQLLGDLEKISIDGGRLLVVSEWEHLNPSNIRTYAKLANIKNTTIVTSDIVFLRDQFAADRFPDQLQLEDYLGSNQYILIAQEFVGSPHLLNKIALEQIQFFVDTGNLELCNKYQAEVSPNSTTCAVGIGEKLLTGSDVIVNGSKIKVGQKTISGLSKVYCKWGCSFRVLEPSSPIKVKMNLLDKYILPNNQPVNLYKITRPN